ncbi:hypothetical protein [Desulfovibrio inopinatus]|uniref:hypothetical protein n=1 Tax=Desulfovibrio inopinatus TaxID=102109 RepID=UPI0003F9C087|nr:hypothetical protein [Desulfovibrio inopinatus]
MKISWINDDLILQPISSDEDKALARLCAIVGVDFVTLADGIRFSPQNEIECEGLQGLAYFLKPVMVRGGSDAPFPSLIVPPQGAEAFIAELKTYVPQFEEQDMDEDFMSHLDQVDPEDVEGRSYWETCRAAFRRGDVATVAAVYNDWARHPVRFTSEERTAMPKAHWRRIARCIQGQSA